MRTRLPALLALLLLASPAPAADAVSSRLRGLLRILTGERTTYGITIDVHRKDEKTRFVVHRSGDESFRLEVRHPKYGFTVQRTPDRTILGIERHSRRYVGKGPSRKPNPSARRISPSGSSPRIRGSAPGGRPSSPSARSTA